MTLEAQPVTGPQAKELPKAGRGAWTTVLLPYSLQRGQPGCSLAQTSASRAQEQSLLVGAARF